MQAIILAAGMGKRLGELTRHNTKCMVTLHGQTLIERTLDALHYAGVERVIIVIGFEGQKVKNLVGQNYKGLPIVYVENPVYNKTNNIYSLYLAREFMCEQDTLLLESDLIFEKDILTELIKNPFPNLAVVDKYQSWMDGTVVTIDSEDNILSFIPKRHFNHKDIGSYYKTVNIYKFSAHFARNDYIPFLEAYSSALGNNEYYEQVLRVLTLLEKNNLKAFRLENQKWYEVDDIQDLNNAEAIFAPENEKLSLFHRRYGGYWRFPKIVDFCYLVNPYFPPERMINEMKCYFESLLGQYPSGLSIQNLLAAKMFGCDPSQILAGNGATELIAAFAPAIKGKVGMMLPTFNEYPEKFGYDRVVAGTSRSENMTYTIEDLKILSETCDYILLVNPDNPTGNYIQFDQIIELADYLKLKGKKLIVDESFNDFAPDRFKNSLIAKETLLQYPNLIVIKSISKSYGVPGLRLGVMATADENLLQQTKKNLPIWNINSFAEFFLQIIDKYEKEFEASCNQIVSDREHLFNELKKLPFIRVIPSDGNYFLCEVTGNFTASQLTDMMLKKFEIFLKDCTGKPGFENKQFIRIGIRNRHDNQQMVEKLHIINKFF